MKRRLSALLAVALAVLAGGAGAQVKSAPAPDDARAREYKQIDTGLEQVSTAAADLEKFIDEAVRTWQGLETKPKGGAAPAAPPEAGAPARSDEVFAAAERRLADQCHASFSIKSVVRGGGKELLAGKSGPPPGSLDVALFDYYECAAFAERNPALCDAPKGLKFEWPQERIPPEARCRRGVHRIILAQAVISRSPDALKACLRDEEGLDPPDQKKSTKQDREAYCAIRLERDPTVACEKLFSSGKGSNPEGVAGCLQAQKSLVGDGEACPAIVEAVDRRLCVGFSNYRRALEAKDPKLCGDSGVCLMMMGGPASCAPYAEVAKGEYCRLWVERRIEERKPALEGERKLLFDRHAGLTQKLAAEENAKQLSWAKQRSQTQASIMESLKAKRAQAESQLGALDAKLEGIDPANFPGYQERKSKYLLLRQRVQQALAQFKSQTGQ